jgi:hypothetical protein
VIIIKVGQQNNINHQENLDGTQPIVKQALPLAAVDKGLNVQDYCHKFA